jgi:hypothetical protein
MQIDGWNGGEKILGGRSVDKKSDPWNQGSLYI